MGHRRPQPPPAQGGCAEFFRERAASASTTSSATRLRAGVRQDLHMLPYPAKVWLNGHEWAKRQADQAGVEYTALSNRFAACPQPERLPAICDSFGPQQVQWFFDRWITAIPTPFTKADRDAGYWWELSMRQVEVSRTLVFDGRAAPAPSSKHWSPTTSASAGPSRSPWCSPARSGTTVPHARLERRHRRQDRLLLQALPDQALPQGRPLPRSRPSSTKPQDLDLPSRIPAPARAIAKARQINQRPLIIERAGPGRAIGSALFERIRSPTAEKGHRTGALRFRLHAMALTGALHILLRRHRLHQQKPWRARPPDSSASHTRPAR